MATLSELIGESPAMTTLKETVGRLLARRPGGSRLPAVLIEGETGTGKGLLARAIHRASGRSEGPFVDVNCAAIPETLLEAELFGHERGAFTDAREAKPGLFEAADGGTLFLDEVGLLPPGAQAKLLKAIEEKVVRRLGSTRDRVVDVWVLGATNVSLGTAVRVGGFREDLYHRLAGVTLRMPALRERADDVVRLAEHFLDRACAEYGVEAKALTPEAAAALAGHRWAGNVRELANVMARVALLAAGDRVTPDMLDLSGGTEGDVPGERPPAGDPGPVVSLRDTLGAVERDRLRQALVEADWNISEAAARLGLARGTLRYRIAKHGLGPAASTSPRVRDAAPAPRGPESPRTNLPRQLTSFIGRESEMTRVKAALGASRLVTLTGAGGVGKTRLAVRVAADLLPSFADGAWLVDLAPLSDPDHVQDAVAAVLGVRTPPGLTLSEALLDYLRPKSLLLVLDNCEHLLAAAAALADQLLRECPGLRILATSREGLGLAGEALQVLSPLAVPSPQGATPPEELLRFEAIQLFAERAVEVHPGFRVTERNAPDVLEICRRLDGIPLALELAAARVRAMAVDQIAARLDDRFRLLTGGSRTALPRHQTLRGVLDWSYQLLSDPERVVFRRLSVFAGGFALAAAEQVCAGDRLSGADVADLVTRLVERSLVVFDPSEGHPPYRLLETIKQYAQTKLFDSGEAEAIRRAHLAYYLGLAEEAEPLLRGPAQMTWLARLATEHDNLHAALGWSLAQPGSAEAGLRLAAALQWFWFLRSPVGEGRRWLERAVANKLETGIAARAKALAGLGMLAWRVNDFPEAQRALEESLTLARAIGDESTLAFALHHEAHVQVMHVADGLTRAAEMWEESTARFRAIGDRWGTAWSLRCLGDNLRALGSPEGAIARLEESLSLLREIRDEWLIGHVLYSLGAIAREQKDYARAQALVEESLAIWSEVGDRYNMAVAHRELGHVARGQGDHDQALACYRVSLDLLQSQGDRYEAARVLEGLAALALAQGHARSAARMLGVADALQRVIGATVRPVDRPDHHPTVAKAREILGDDGFETAFADGRGMSVDQVVAEVWPAAHASVDTARRSAEIGAE
jgi:non-specific serine/threonine protein kinase